MSLKALQLFPKGYRLLHIKTVPKLYLNNFNLNEKELSQLPTHELITRLGFASHPKAGLVDWLPLGWTIIEKIKSIVRRNMKEINGEEVSLSSLSSSDLWIRTGRWNNSELFKLKDSTSAEYCLAATAEEGITQLVKDRINSYKSLPLLYYQMKEKFRDEKRPRGGLLRGREFLMKDAYSFDMDEQLALKSYQQVTDAYVQIFSELKVPFTRADADSGNIGGSLSHEWHYVSDVGEDTILSCDACENTSNVEKALSFPDKIDESASVAVAYFTTLDRATLICAYYPESRELQTSFIELEVPDIDPSVTNEKQILDEFSNEDTMIGKRVVRIMDSRLNLRSPLPDFPIPFVNRSLITTLTDVPIVSAIEGEICEKCEEGHLHAHNCIEVGHTFYLGDKYSKPMELTVDVPNENGKLELHNVLMGCYGIGISRILAAIAELNRDAKGLRWPVSIAPWNVTVVESPAFNAADAEKVYQMLEDGKISYRLDDRQKVGIGKKINQSHLVGIPLVIILGKNFPYVEIEVRGKRYTKDHNWEDLHKSKSLDWEVTRDARGEDVKHLVHIDALCNVLHSLLIDM